MARNATLRRFRLEWLIVALVVLSLAGFGTRFGWFDTLDRLTFDFVVRLVPIPADERIVIVGIDAQTLAQIGRWPWPREVQAQLIDTLLDSEPQALFVDVIYSENATPEADAALLGAFRSEIPTMLPVLVDALTSGGALIEQLPFVELLDEVDVLGHVHVQLEADGIARGSYLREGIGEPYWPHVGVALAAHLAGEEVPECETTTSFSIANERCDYRRIRFAGPPDTFGHISALSVLHGRIDPESIRDKIVFLGRTDVAAPDAVPASVSAGSRPMAGVEYNANVLNAVWHDGLVREILWSWQFALTLGLVALTLLLLPRMRPRQMLLSAIALTLLPLLISAVGILAGDVYLNLAAASVCSALVYPLWSWRRNEMGWRFVGEELDRLAEEAFRWSRSRAQVEDDQYGDRLQWLLDREAADVEPNLDSDDLSTLDAAELEIIRALLADQRQDAVGNAKTADPFVARILRINNLADDVRVGRGVSLAGLDQMPVGLCVFVGSGNVLLANAKFMEITAISQPHSYFVLDALQGLPNVPWSSLLREVVLGGASQVVEAETPSGLKLMIRIARLEATGYRQPVCLMTLTDVTDIRRAQERREETLAFVSHDLRSPISSILALVRNAQTDDWRTVANRIQAYAEKSLQVSEQFVQLSRVENQVDLELYEIDLVAVVESAVDEMFHEVQEKSSRIEVEIAPSLLPEEGASWMHGDGELLERLFINLLGNAIKYSDVGSVVRVQLEGTDEQLTVSVVDQGYGIPADEISRIFDPYFRSSSPELAQQRGTGLGLRFVRTVVEHHQGEIFVTSEVGKGTTIRIDFPRFVKRL